MRFQGLRERTLLQESAGENFPYPGTKQSFHSTLETSLEMQLVLKQTYHLRQLYVKMQRAHAVQREKGTNNPGQGHHNDHRQEGQASGAKCHQHCCTRENQVVSFENKDPGKLGFPGQPTVFSVGWSPCFLTLIAQGGSGAGRGSGLWSWEKV